MQKFYTTLLLVALATTLTGCNLFKGSGGGAETSATTDASTDEADPVTRDEFTRLSVKVQDHEEYGNRLTAVETEVRSQGSRLGIVETTATRADTRANDAYNLAMGRGLSRPLTYDPASSTDPDTATGGVDPFATAPSGTVIFSRRPSTRPGTTPARTYEEGVAAGREEVKKEEEEAKKVAAEKKLRSDVKSLQGQVKALKSESAHLNRTVDNLTDPAQRSLLSRVRQYLNDTTAEQIKFLYPEVDAKTLRSKILTWKQYDKGGINFSKYVWDTIAYDGMKIKIYISLKSNDAYFQVLPGGITSRGERGFVGDDLSSSRKNDPPPTSTTPEKKEKEAKKKKESKPVEKKEEGPTLVPPCPTPAVMATNSRPYKPLTNHMPAAGR